MQSLEAARPGISQESKEASVTTRVARKEEGDVDSGQVEGPMGIECELCPWCDGRPQADRSQNQGVMGSGGRARSRPWGQSGGSWRVDNYGARTLGRSAGALVPSQAWGQAAPTSQQHFGSSWGSVTSFFTVLKRACLPLGNSLNYEPSSCASWQGA